MRILAVAQIADLLEREVDAIGERRPHRLSAGSAARTGRRRRESSPASRRSRCRTRPCARTPSASARSGTPALGVAVERVEQRARSRPDRRRPARRGNSWPRRGPCDGPPMSISSTSASNGVAGFVAVFANGYRLTTTTSTRPMPWRRSGREIVGMIAAREDAAVQRRVQRLDAAVHHFGKAGDVGDAGDREAGVGQRARRAAGRHQLEAAGGEAAAEVDDPGLVRNAQQGSWHNAESPVLSLPTPGGPGAVRERPHNAAFFFVQRRGHRVTASRK